MSTPLEAAMAAINSAVPSTADESQRLVAAKCRALLRGYDSRWRNERYVPVGVEQLSTSDLVNPETAKRSRSFTLAGKLDVVATLNGQVVLIDHKTTTQDVADPDSMYWRQMVVESQPSHYMMLEWLNGRKIDGAVWDVVRKPAIKPTAIPLVDADGLKVVHDVEGNRVKTKDGKKWRESGDTAAGYVLQTRPQTVDEYEARLDEDIATRPEWYFFRRPVPRLDHEIVEHAQETWDIAQDLLVARREDRWPRNSGACILYNSPCEYLGICSGFDTPDSDKWQRRENVHPELPTLEGDGKNVLTNSRIRCFQTCRKKHFFKYELGLERQDEEEREALYFGTIFHLALEAWWKELIPKE